MRPYAHLGFPGGSDGKESACSAGDLGLIPGFGRSPGEGNGNPLQYSCLENPMDGGAWQATVHRVTKGQTWLSDFTLYAHLNNLRHILKYWYFFLETPELCMYIHLFILHSVYHTNSSYNVRYEFGTSHEKIYNKLWKIKEMGIPDHLTCHLRNLYAGQEATVRTGHGTTDWF